MRELFWDQWQISPVIKKKFQIRIFLAFVNILPVSPHSTLDPDLVLGLFLFASRLAQAEGMCWLTKPESRGSALASESRGAGRKDGSGCSVAHPQTPAPLQPWASQLGLGADSAWSLCLSLISFSPSLSPFFFIFVFLILKIYMWLAYSAFGLCLSRQVRFSCVWEAPLPLET